MEAQNKEEHTVFGRKNPANRFHKVRKKHIKMEENSGRGVNETSIIPNVV